ncbi:MAG: response regulator [Clostridiales bacterium]|nr:response regulator [Clostridiales bacterium]
MATAICRVLILAGAALMVFNILRYRRFAKKLRESGDWSSERLALMLPFVLLCLFFLGYLAVALAGEPDFVIAFILLGGSIFVAIVVFMLSGITDRIRENEQLAAALLAAEEANHAKTRFLSNMSHDLRTPMNAILGYTHLGLREGAKEEEMRSCLEKIGRSGNQMLSVVNDVLEMSSIESGRLELVPEPVRLCRILHECCDMMEGEMERQGLTFTRDIADTRTQWVLCDGRRLSRVVLNLLSNACKYTKPGGSVQASLRITDDAEETVACEISVRDTGIGMSEGFARNLFDPFERERTAETEEIQGTGLGMAITKRIVDAMGGEIEVRTQQGEGTEFIVRLRLPRTEPGEDCGCPHGSAADGNGAEGAENEAPSFRGLRLLLAEDNEINREMASMILSAEGFTVDTAENGRKAVDMLAAAPAGFYAVVLMDIQMPVMNGYEAARAIRALEDPEKAGIPVLAMTANAFREDVAAAEAAGMDGHIAKPLDVPKMMETLRCVLLKKDNEKRRQALP